MKKYLPCTYDRQYIIWTKWCNIFIIVVHIKYSRTVLTRFIKLLNNLHFLSMVRTMKFVKHIYSSHICLFIYFIYQRIIGSPITRTRIYHCDCRFEISINVLKYYILIPQIMIIQTIARIFCIFLEILQWYLIASKTNNSPRGQ